MNHNPKIIAAALALLCFNGVASSAQERVVSGSVRTSSGAPVEGALIRAVTSGTGTTTDRRGEFRLALSPSSDSLSSELLLIEVPNVAQREIRIQMHETPPNVTVEFSEPAVRLSEVVITGTAGTQTRRAQAGVITTVPVAQLMRTLAFPALSDVLRGRVTGLDFTPSSGSTGQAHRLWLRGGTSIALSNEPLVFVDGIRADARVMSNNTNGGQALSRLSDIAPGDVERIEIAKGPAAASLYGADASPGVIQIFTKRGAVGHSALVQQAEIEFGALIPEWRPPANFAACRAQDVAPGAASILCRGQIVGAVVADNPLVRSGMVGHGETRALRWSAAGGGSNFGAYTALISETESGTLPQNAFRRGSFRLNMRWAAAPSLTIDGGFALLRTVTSVPQNGDNPSGILANGMLGNPLTVGTLRDGWFSSPGEALATVEQVSKVVRAMPTLQVAHSTGPWDQRLVFGADVSNTAAVLFVPLRHDNVFPASWARGLVGEDQISYELYTVDYLGSVRLLDERLSGFTLRASGGAQYIESNEDRVTAIGTGLVSNDARRVSDAALRSGSQANLRTRAAGLFIQTELGYRRRAFVQLGARADRHSAFGTDAGLQLFPKAGVSVVVADGSRTPLFGVLQTLRARAAYGMSGRAPRQGDAGLSYRASPHLTAPGQIAQGLLPLSPGNRDLRPERGSEFEAGVDASLFDGHVGLELTYFDKRSRNLLFRIPVPPSLGFTVDPLGNIGSLRNRGLEATMFGTFTAGRVGIATQLGLTALQNRLTDLGDLPPFTGWPGSRFVVGRPLGALYDYRVLRVDTVANLAIVTDTTEFVGNSMPSRQIFLNSTFDLPRNVRVHVGFDGKYGYWQHNMTPDVRDRYVGSSERNARMDQLPTDERLRLFGPFATETGRAVGPTSVLRPYLQDASFLRLREFAITWDLPFRATRTTRTRGTSLTLAGHNLGLWTSYRGDPEAVSYVSETGKGGNGQYAQPHFMTMPQPRRWTARVSVRY